MLKLLVQILSIRTTILGYTEAQPNTCANYSYKKLNVFVFIISSLFVFNTTGFAHQRDHTAVVLVDMQPRFLNEKYIGFTELVENQIKLLLWAKEQNLPVLIFEYNLGQNEMEMIFPLKDLLVTLPNYKLIWKTMDGGFDEESNVRENPEVFLKTRKINTLIFAGVTGSACVAKTVEGALKRGFIVLSAANIVASYGNQDHVYPDKKWWPKHKNFYGFEQLSDLISNQNFLRSAEQFLQKTYDSSLKITNP